MYLAGINNWGLHQPHELQGNTGSHFSIHTKVSKGRVAPTQSSPATINIIGTFPSEMDSDNEEDFPTAEVNDPPKVWRACTQQTTTVHSPDTPQLNNWPYSQTSNPDPATIQDVPYQKQNQWMSQFQMTYQMSSIFLKKNFTQIMNLWYGVYSKINSYI